MYTSQIEKVAVVIRCNVIIILWPGHCFFKFSGLGGLGDKKTGKAFKGFTPTPRGPFLSHFNASLRKSIK